MPTVPLSAVFICGQIAWHRQSAANLAQWCSWRGGDFSETAVRWSLGLATAFCRASSPSFTVDLLLFMLFAWFQVVMC